MADLLATAFQQLLRIGKVRATEEKKADPSRIQRDRKDHVRRALRRAESDGERVVIVVHKLNGAGQSRPHLGKRFLSQGADFRRVLGNEARELFFRSLVLHSV